VSGLTGLHTVRYNMSMDSVLCDLYIGLNNGEIKSQGTEFPGRDDRKILPFVRIEQVKLKL
jgi:hypothetical protein